jgi:tRNA pseudouridine55 synthase
VGHTGTLDPFASGLLLLCVGQATRLAEYLTGLSKCYRAVARLGLETDTLDLQGEPVGPEVDPSGVTEDQVREALAALRGDILQVPPQFSAKKVDGEAMHRRARRGEHMELTPVPVTIHEVALTAFDPPRIHFELCCSSGTYVRAVARDLGRALGVGAHLTALRRTSVGAFDVADAIAPTELADPERVASAAVEPVRAVGHLASVEVDDDGAARLRHGQRIRLAPSGAAGATKERVAVCQGGALLAIGELDDGVLRPRKVFVS